MNTYCQVIGTYAMCWLKYCHERWHILTQSFMYIQARTIEHELSFCFVSRSSGESSKTDWQWHMVCRRGNLLEQTHQPIEGLMHFGRDWTLTLLSCLILYLKLLNKYWIQRLLDHDHHSQLFMQRFGFWNQS